MKQKIKSQNIIPKKFIFQVIILGTLFLMLILIAGCKPKLDPYPMSNKEFQKGSDGLVFDFVKNGPPDNIFEGEDFEIATNVWNKGAYPITEAYLTVTVEEAYMCILDGSKNCVNIKQTSSGTGSIPPSTIPHSSPPSSTSSSNTNPVSNVQLNKVITKDLILDIDSNGEFLQGRQVQYPDGTSRYVNYNARAKQLDLLSEQHTSPVVLTACYNYMTELSTDICIDPDTSGTNSVQRVCDVKDISFTDQGAPVAITKIETQVLPDNDNVRVGFVIYIQNRGDGEVLDKFKLKEACTSSKLYNDDWNKVYLSEFRFSNERYKYVRGASDNNIKCEPEPLKLTKDTTQDFIRCTIDNSKLASEDIIKRSDPSYTTQAYVKFEYGYTNTISKSVVVKKIR